MCVFAKLMRVSAWPTKADQLRLRQHALYWFQYARIKFDAKLRSLLKAEWMYVWDHISNLVSKSVHFHNAYNSHSRSNAYRITCLRIQNLNERGCDVFCLLPYTTQSIYKNRNFQQMFGKTYWEHGWLKWVVDRNWHFERSTAYDWLDL